MEERLKLAPTVRGAVIGIQPLIELLREQHPKATKAEMFKIVHAAMREPENKGHLLEIIEETVGGWLDESGAV